MVDICNAIKQSQTVIFILSYNVTPVQILTYYIATSISSPKVHPSIHSQWT